MAQPRSRFPAYPPSTDKDLSLYLEAIRQEIERLGTSGLATIKVEEADAVISAAASTLDFAGADFVLSESPAGEVNISIEAGIARLATAQTWIATQTFTPPLIVGTDIGGVYDVRIRERVIIGNATRSIGGTGAALGLVSATTPVFGISFENGALNEKIWRWYNPASTQLTLFAVNDAFSTENAIVTFQRSGITPGGTLFGGFVQADGGGGALKLKPGTTADHVYMEFYADSAAPSTRSAWAGFGGTGTLDFSIANEMGGDIDLIPGDDVQVRRSGATAPANSSLFQIWADADNPLTIRTSSWAAIWEHHTVDRQFRIDNATDFVRFHHGAAANVAARYVGLDLEAATKFFGPIVGLTVNLGRSGQAWGQGFFAGLTVTTSGVDATGNSIFRNDVEVQGHLLILGQSRSPLHDNGTKTANFTIDWNNGNHQRVTLGAAALTITFTNGASGGVYSLEVVQDGTGSRTVTWPTAVHWHNNVTPILTTAATKADVFTFLYDDVPATDIYIGTTFAKAVVI